MNFNIGQKVVCVDDKLRYPAGMQFARSDGSVGISDGDMGGLRRNAIYTVARIHAGKVGVDIELDEISRGPTDRGFCATRFRPLIERSTDTGMAILRKIEDDAARKRELTVCGND